jgi:hypothetical protein
MSDMRPAQEVIDEIRAAGLAYERLELIPGSTYKDNSTIVIIPTRGMMHQKFVNSFLHLITPMNQKRAVLFCSGDEVGRAYDRMIKAILDDPELSKWKYVLTIEDDNLIPPDAHVRLLESIEFGQFDAVSGIYFTKGDMLNMPMAYGDPDEYARTGVLDFKPRDVREGLVQGHIMPVNGIAMGCGLWRLDLFRQVPAPWFVTVADVVPEKGGAQCFTQDLWFCNNAKSAGKRFAVDLRVRVGHMDVNTGIVY